MNLVCTSHVTQNSTDSTVLAYTPQIAAPIPDPESGAGMRTSFCTLRIAQNDVGSTFTAGDGNSKSQKKISTIKARDR